MIKKLRLRFIISALLSILFVLSATIATINIVNYVKTENESQRALNMIVENERLDREGGGGGFGFGGQTRPGDTRNREHYFIAIFSDDELRYCDTSHIFTISQEDAEKLASDVYKGNKTQGKVGSLMYKKELINEDYGMGVSYSYDYISFVDVSDKMRSFNNFLTSSIIISSVSYVIIAALIIVSSHFVFKTSEESYRKQKAFITNASHELKTPLTIINTDVEILRMDHGENEWTESISDQVRRLTTMTNQLVTLSKLDEGSLQNYPFTNFSLSQLANKVSNTFATTYKANKLNFTSEIENDITIKGNRYLINELLYIFLDNALKYAKPKGDVRLDLKKNKNKVEMTFSNDIEDDEIDIKQIFERFYRSPSSNKKEGSGIGLSIAKEIIDLHKAKVNTFVKNKKITFVITF